MAAAWAMIAGWMRTVGQVTAVWMRNSEVCAAIAPRTDQTNVDSPCSAFQGWKWSEIHAVVKPACSARAAMSTRVGAACSSEDRKNPI